MSSQRRRGDLRTVSRRQRRVGTSELALASPRRLLRLAQVWRVMDRVPRIRLLPGERNREFTLSYQQEASYLAMAPQPLKDVAILILDTGLRVGEVLALEWKEIHPEPADGARFGYLHVRDGKSRLARRNVPLTARVRAMLERRKAANGSPWVFAEDAVRPILISSLDDLHKKLRQTLKLSGEFVLHSLRHTHGTRLGESGADVFTIVRLMGHSSVTVSQRYVCAMPEALEQAVERLEALNRRVARSLPERQNRLLPATASATPEAGLLVGH